MSPIRNAGLVVELGLDVCIAFMNRDDWRDACARWEDQTRRMELKPGWQARQ